MAKTKLPKAHRDYRQEQTDALIAAIKSGTAPWQTPFLPGTEGRRPFNFISGKSYRGGNALLLSIASQMEFGGDPRWMTFKQASERGMRIKPGSKGNIVEYWQFEKEEEVVGENGEKKKEHVKLDSPFVRRSVVFNGQQIEGMPELAPTPKGEIERMELAERIIANSGAVIKFDTPGRAFYTPARDEIHSAPKNAYRSTEDYYSTLLHELGHWTGHADRLDREAYSAALKGHIPKDMYAKEELRAEIASYFLAMDTGIAVTEGHLKNHAAYVASWLEALKKDKNEIYRAAKDADGICEYLTRGLELEYGENMEVEAEKVILKPLEIWTTKDADIVLKEIDGILAVEREHDRRLGLDLEKAPVGEKGKVMDAYEKEYQTRRPDMDRANRYLSKIREWQRISEEHYEKSIDDADTVILNDPHTRVLPVRQELSEEGGVEMGEKVVNGRYERKTIDVVPPGGFLNRGFDKTKSKVVTGWIKGEVKEYRDVKNGVFRVDFTAALKAPGADGKFPDKTPFILASHSSTEPIDLSQFKDGKAPLLLVGQQFLISPRDAGGRPKGERRPVLLVRAMHEALPGEKHHGRVVSSADRAVKNEFERASKELLTGYVYENERNVFNKPLEFDNPETGKRETFGYAQRFSVSYQVYKDGKPVVGEDGKTIWDWMKVDTVTKEKLDTSMVISKDGQKKRLSLKGAFRVFDYQTKEKEWVNNAVSMELGKMSVYREKEKHLDVQESKAVEAVGLPAPARAKSKGKSMGLGL